MRRTLLVLIALGLTLAASCSKKAAPPTAPPASPSCEVSTTSLAFGTVSVGGSADRQFTLTNTGGGTLTGTVSESCAEFSLVGAASYGLGAGQSATFTVRFSPVSVGAKTCALAIGNSGCSAVTCSGTGQAASGPVCATSSASLDFGSVQVGEFATRTFTIGNTGTDTLKGTVSESCADVRLRGSGTYAVAAGQSATFTLDFYPASAGPLSCSINTGTSCPSVSCTGTGIGGLSGACTVSPTSLDFGSVPAGVGVVCKTFTVTNASSSTIISGTPYFRCPCLDWDWASGSGGSYYLNPGESKTYTFCFKPASTGLKEATIIIPERNEFCSSISCTGLGVEPPPVCAVDVFNSTTNTVNLGTLAVGQERYYPSAVDFGIANRGGGNLSGTVSEACPSIDLHRPSGGGLSYALGANQSAEFGIRYAPLSPGAQNCTIETGNAACSDVRVLANAITSSSPCWVETPTIDFGIVRPGLGSTVRRFLRLTNVFGTSLSGEIYEPCSDFAFSGPSLAFGLGPGGSAQWEVVFTPGGMAVGDRTCALNLDRTGTSSCPLVQCSATVKSTAGTAAPLTLAFPATRVGESSQLTLTIRSDTPLSGTVSVPCPEFSVVGSPDYSIGAGGQATFTIRYTPTAVGLHQCTVSTGSDCESVWALGSGYVP